MQEVLFMALGPFVFIHVTYLVALSRKDFSVIDTAWSIGFMLIALAGCFLSNFSNSLENIILIVVLIWGIRLSWFLHSRNMKNGEDARYKAWREEWGEKANQIAYFKVYLLQYGLLIVASLPIFAIHLSPNQEWSLLTVVGVLLWILGFTWEAVADHQKSVFKKINPKKVCTVGLWSLSRHPNYFGEATLWYGIGLMALASQSWWALIGPLFLNFLLVKVSGIPLTEKKQQGNPEYDNYKKSTPAMIPNFFKALNSGSLR